MTSKDVIAQLRGLDRQMDQTQVAERSGGITGFNTFYDQGTYVPTYLGVTTAGVTTYTTQIGSYTRVGRTVYVFGRVVWTAATGTGPAIISVPLTAVYTRVTRYPVYLYPVNVTFANGSLVGVLDSGTSATAFLIGSPATNAATALTVVEAAGDLSFAVMYDVA